MIPVGIDDFRDLVSFKDPDGRKHLFIDKSLFIRDFLKGNDKVTLITRPRRFGKTINLSMLEYFFNREVGSYSTKGLFDGLKVAQYPNIMAYQGKTPAIFISFKEIKGKNFDESYELIKEKIGALYEKHLYLLDSDRIYDHQKRRIENFIDLKCGFAQYKTSLQYLSKLLYRYSGFTKTIILIDEYDSPLNNAYVNRFYEDMRSFMAALFSDALKGNTCLMKGMITGIIKIAKSSLFSELSNVSDYTCLDSPVYSSYFGFTEEELNEYLDKAGLPANDHKLKNMYNGYNINGITLYNPFSIVKFIHNSLKTNDIEKSIKPYWINTGGHSLIKYILSLNIEDLQEDLIKILNNQPITTYIDESIIMGDYLRGSSISFWSLMLLSGYLKPISKQKEEDFDYKYELSFPNQEVKASFRKLLIQILAGGIDNENKYKEAMKSLSKGKVKEFEDFLVKYMKQTPSYYDVSEGSQEKFYHGMMLGMTACLHNSHIIRSNRESGKGRYDICLEPKDKNEKGIIIELKAGKENEDLDKLAKTAYSQIKDKEYKRDLDSKGIKEIIPLGIAFFKKDVKLYHD